MNKKLYTIFFLTVFLLLPFRILAIAPLPQPGANSLDINNAIAGIFFFIWPIFGAIAILMFIFAGFTFLTANGEPSKVATARKALMWGIIGVVVALLSSSIPFVINNIIT